MSRFSVAFHLRHLYLSVSQVFSYYHQEVDLKVSPEGEGFNPMIQTIKIGAKDNPVIVAVFWPLS